MPKKKNFAEEIPDELNSEETFEVETNLPAKRTTSTALINPNAALEFNLEGVRPPYLTLVHGTSQSASTFNAGDLVLAKENLVCPRGKTIDVVILNIRQYQRQRVNNEDWKAGVRPAEFDTVKQAKEAGFQTEWVNGVGPEVSPAMDLVLLLRKPKDIVCGLFGIDIGDGNEYAICQMTADKTGYTYLLQDIGLVIKTKLRNTGLFSAVWTASTEMSKPNKKGNRTQVIRFKFKEMLDPKIVQAIDSVIGTPSNG